jgi:hypothetical protein
MMFEKKIPFKKLSSIVALGLLAGSASANVLHDNTNLQEFGSQGIPPGWMASAFRVSESACPFGCDVGDITLLLRSGTLFGPTAGISLQVYSDSANQTDAPSAPGSSLISMINPSSFNTTAKLAVFSAPQQDTNSPAVFQKNNWYWVYLSATAEAALTEWSYDGGPGYWAFDRGEGAQFGDEGPFIMKVEGVKRSGLTGPIDPPGEVPLPGTVWLMGSALIGLLSTWRKKPA